MRKRLLLIIFMLCQLIGGVALTVSASTVYCINGVEISCDDYSSSPGNCRVYAEKFYRDLWGTGFSSYFQDDDNLLRNLETEDLVLTEVNLKKYVEQAAIGSVIRVSSLTYLHRNDGNQGHTQLIVQKDENGFTVLEGGMAEAPYYREHYYTWNEFVTTHWLGGKYGYLKYIKWPGAPEFSENYDVESPTVSELVVTAADDGRSFSAAFVAKDEYEITDTYLRVWPAGSSEEEAEQYQCEWDGTIAMAVISADSLGTNVRNLYCKWYAVDDSGNVSCEEQEPVLVSLYAPDVTFRGIGEILADNTPIRSIPCAEIDGKDTQESTAAAGESYWVTGIYRDADGNGWYMLEDGLWVSMQDVKYDTLASLYDWIFAGYEEKSVIYLDGQMLFIGE